MSKLDEFYSLLSTIYGSKIVENLIKKEVKRDVISFKHDEFELTKFIYEYYLSLDKNSQSQIEGCTKCKDICKGSFKTRPFEFSNWRGDLDFNKEHVKDIMIIGLEAGPMMKTHLNFSYGLCNLPVETDGTMDWNKIDKLLSLVEKEILSEKKYIHKDVRKIFSEVKFRHSIKHKLWQYLYEIFSEPDNNLKRILDSLYITDVVRCNLDPDRNEPSKDSRENCKDFFFKEIKLINPKLVLIMGNSAYSTFESLLSESGLEFKEDKQIKFPKPQKEDSNSHFGYFVLNINKIYVYHIYHNKGYYNSIELEDRAIYKVKNQSFFLNELKPKVLKWNRNNNSSSI